MGEWPNIVRERILKPAVVGIALLLIAIVLFLRGNRTDAMLILLFAVALAANAADFFAQYRKEKITVFQGMCVGVEEEKNILGQVKVRYFQIRRFASESGADEQELIYLKRQKNIKLHVGVKYELAFRNLGDFNENTMIAYKKIGGMESYEKEGGVKTDAGTK